jgi:SAM-dependent methyltransferase
MDAVWHLPKRFRRLLTEATFDRRMGVQTSPLVAVTDLGVEAGQLDAIGVNARGTAYMPTPAWAVPAIISELNLHHPDYTFIDLGSGMGRVVLIAAQYPFRRVVGVELSLELNRIAGENLSRLGNALRAEAVDLIRLDAREYEFPPGNLAVYMFNPFQAQVMQVVLENLRRRFDPQDAELYIIYFNPVQAPLLDASPYLEKIRTTRLYSVYRSRPSQRPVNITPPRQPAELRKRSRNTATEATTAASNSERDQA